MKPLPRFLRRISLTLCVLSFAASLSARAQQATTPSQSSSANAEFFSAELIHQLESIKSAALSDDYAYQRLAHLTENIGPRPVGSPAAKAAIEYVAAEMRHLGLDVHLEKVQVPHWVRGLESAELVDGPGFTREAQRKVVLTALSGSTSTGAGGISAELLVLDNFDQLHALGRDKVAGKIVLLNAKFDERKAEAGLGFDAYREVVGYREAGATQAAQLGAAAVLIRSIGNASYRLPHAGYSDPAGIPAAAVCAEDADLIAYLAEQGPLRMHLTLTPQTLSDETSYNVIADLKGSEHPEDIVVVSGHLDSWDLGTGAIDDGAGVVLAMETAQLLQQLHLQSKRTLRVIAWIDEEIDGTGSAQYMKDHQGELKNHIAAIESDAGASHPLGLALNMKKAAADALAPLQSVLSSIGAASFEQTSRAPGTTDVAPMAEQGVPVIGILDDMRTYYSYHHTAADTVDKVIPSELRENAAMMAVTAYAIANMKNPPPR
jgi:carboxypeptidase Q